jgi:cyclophilin family peptidyl-prolyl cis-trans isomerase
MSALSKNLSIALVLTAFFGGIYFLDQKSQINSSEPAVQANVSAGVSRDKIVATLKTNFGDIKIELFAKDAPKTVANFANLAQSGFYNSTKFHRVIPEFMIQGGDPFSRDNNWDDDGFGGPGYVFEDEINQHKLVRGTLAMANSGPNTNGSQFFIVTADATPWLDGRHTAFGRVISGMEVVAQIESLPRNANDHPLENAVIQSIVIE